MASEQIIFTPIIIPGLPAFPSQHGYVPPIIEWQLEGETHYWSGKYGQRIASKISVLKQQLEIGYQVTVRVDDLPYRDLTREFSQPEYPSPSMSSELYAKYVVKQLEIKMSRKENSDVK